MPYKNTIDNYVCLHFETKLSSTLSMSAKLFYSVLHFVLRSMNYNIEKHEAQLASHTYLAHSFKKSESTFKA
jgi:hypothetical protein